MNWKAEDKIVTQEKYGHYCNICREIKIEPVAYHKFDVKLFDEVKKIRKEIKAKQKING